MSLYLDLRKARQLGLFDQPPKPAAAKPAASKPAASKFEPGQTLSRGATKYKIQSVRRDGSSMTIRQVGADGKLTGPVKRVNPSMFGAGGGPVSAPAAPKPAAAWQGVPNSKVPGAQRKREGGKWVYRYPQPGGGWGAAPHKKGTDDLSRKEDRLVAASEKLGRAAYAAGLKLADFTADAEFLKLGAEWNAGMAPLIQGWETGWRAAKAARGGKQGDPPSWSESTKDTTQLHVWVANAVGRAVARGETVYGKKITASDIADHKDAWLPAAKKDYDLGAKSGEVAHDIAIRTKGAMMRKREQADEDARKKAMLGELPSTKPKPGPPPAPDKKKQEPPRKQPERELADVGEKIGGARKDMWAMTAAERDELEKDPVAAHKATTRKAVFGEYTEADAEADKDAGVPAAVAWWKNTILKHIATRPPDSKEMRDHYHQAAKYVQEAFSRMKDPQDPIVFMREWKDLATGARPKRVSGITERYVNEHMAKKPMPAGFKPLTEEQIADAKEAIGKVSGWGYESGRTFVYVDLPEDEANAYRNMTQAMGQRFASLMGLATKKRRYGEGFSMWGSFYSPNALNKAVNQFRQDMGKDDKWAWVGAKAKKKGGPRAQVERGKGEGKEVVFHRNLGKVERVGLPDVPGGQTGEDMMKSFGLRAVEYGNWASDTERQWHTEMCHASFKDLAGALGIPEEHIAINGRLGIGFGSRGKGGKHAGLAHYEPDRRVINLTKMNGNGSLAHEWGHFMDNALFRAYNPGVGKVGFVSDGEVSNVPEKLRTAMADVMKAIKTEVVPPSKVGELAKKKRDLKWKIEAERQNVRAAQVRFMRRGSTDEDRQAYRDAVDKANAVIEEYNNVQTPRPDGTVTSKHLIAAQNMGKYWAKDVELFARSFESYVEDKLHKKGQRSSYLVDGTLHASNPSGTYLPHGHPHRERINAAMDKFIAAMKEHGQFEKSAVAWLTDLRKAERRPLYIRT